MALTKKDLAEQINKKIGLSKLEATRIIDDFFDKIKHSVKKNEIVKLAQFGTFKTRNKPERIGRNPKTKETAVISERKIVSFNPTTKLKNKINKKPG